MIKVDVALLTFLAGSIVPLVTALITKARASSRVKSTATLVLSAFAGGVAYLLQNKGAGNWQGLAQSCIFTYLGAGTVYQNFLKPIGIASKLAEISPNSGIGKAQVFPNEQEEIEVPLPGTEAKIAALEATMPDVPGDVINGSAAQSTGVIVLPEPDTIPTTGSPVPLLTGDPVLMLCYPVIDNLE